MGEGRGEKTLLRRGERREERESSTPSSSPSSRKRPQEKNESF
jgi:hypothetical protein